MRWCQRWLNERDEHYNIWNITNFKRKTFPVVILIKSYRTSFWIWECHRDDQLTHCRSTFCNMWNENIVFYRIMCKSGNNVGLFWFSIFKKILCQNVGCSTFYLIWKLSHDFSNLLENQCWYNEQEKKFIFRGFK